MSQNPLADEFSLLTGFDVPKAVALLGGNSALYKKIILGFAERYRNDYAQIQSEVEGNDIEVVRRHAHTMKGLAGSIGHDGLREVSMALEAACASGAPNAELRQDMLDALRNVLSVLENFARAGTAAPKAPAPVDKAATLAGIDKLRMLLETDDGKVDTAFEELAPNLRAVAPDMVPELRAAVRNFEFETALELLRKVEAKLM